MQDGWIFDCSFIRGSDERTGHFQYTGHKSVEHLVCECVCVQATALLSCLAVWLAADRSNLFAVFRSEPKYLLLGGVLGAGITWTVIKAMAMLGPARAVLFIVVAQIAAAYLVELFGLFGVEKAAWEWRKAIGLAVAAAGIAVFQWK